MWVNTEEISVGNFLLPNGEMMELYVAKFNNGCTIINDTIYKKHWVWRVSIGKLGNAYGDDEYTCKGDAVKAVNNWMKGIFGDMK